MTWIYEQLTGELWHNDGLIATGYSGTGEGKNNPAMQDVQSVGPIPQGLYKIGEPRDTATHGPHVLDLTPDPDNEMFGRSEFLIHGDSKSNPGTASKGCIILSRTVRDYITATKDPQLVVIKGDDNV